MPWVPAVDGSRPADDSLPDLGLLAEELLLEEVLELLLDDELELLLEDGLELLEGVLGGCGTVGLLALGHPVNSRHAAVSAPGKSRRFTCVTVLLLDFISPGHCFRILRFPHRQSGSELRFAQRAHDAVCCSFV